MLSIILKVLQCIGLSLYTVQDDALYKFTLLSYLLTYSVST